MKKILLFCISILLFSNAFAAHISGGEMSYVYLGPGTLPGTLKYQVTLKLYRDCGSGGAALDPIVTFTVFNTATSTQFLNIQNIPGSAIVRIQKSPVDPCIDDPIELLVCFDYRIYTTVIDNLPITPDGFTVAYQRCCRVNSMENINSNDVGSTYFTKIPGNFNPGSETNTSPLFKTSDTVLICSARPFTFDFSATDADGDSLVYRFYNAFEGGGNNPGTCYTCLAPDPASPPPYTPVSYINGYSFLTPLGPLVTINTNTGLVGGTAPNVGALGNKIFAITVLVLEYRNGIVIGEHFKDLQIRIVDCQIPTAVLDPVYTSCDGFTVNFQNNAPNNPPPTYFWDFGDPISGANNTSTLPTPSHTYTDTGVFIVKLVLNQGLQCGDSTTMLVRVYPNFLPGFITSPALCLNAPIQFTDTSYFQYGNVIAWRWDFGDAPPGDPGDTSHLQNPVYSYTNSGLHTVELIVTNDKGCVKTYTKQILINDNPLLSVFPADSVYCGLDTLQLNGVGTGVFNWTPPINIIGANTATPRVFPNTTTKYYARLTDINGCITNDSLTVVPKFDLSNAIAGPTTICEEDTVVLRGTSNYSNNITWRWTPIATAESPTIDTTRVYPIVTTTYNLRTQWGNNCVVNKTHTINVIPLAIPNAGPDAFVCSGGQTWTQLNATGGISYQWTPVTGLSNPNIANPVASPTVPTYYVVAVAVAGCPKLRTDTVFVDVSAVPVFNTINDTLICDIDTLQLATNGTGSYAWTPNYMISNTTIASPLVSPNVPTWYHVTLTDPVGCKSKDSVFVDVKDHVSLNAGADTTICQTDGFFLNPASDALKYKWIPATYLNYDTLKNPFARPLTTITYQLIGNIGKCQSTDEVTINVVPYPPANAGPDTSICTGFSVQLNATGGSIYAWSPSSFLTNTNIPNPVSVRPTANIRYIVTVRDNLGCPKPVKDTVWVRVYPAVIADAGPRDTTAVLGEPMFLKGSGGATYTWFPSTWLNDPNIQNPVSLPKADIEYILTATNIAGCIGTDTIHITLYDLDPDMYVPNAFTPDGNGTNDVLRPILIGMKDLTYFRVYNRWGVLMFSTTEKGRGWDGRYNGKAQDPAAYVWMAEGVTYKGEKKTKKGSAVLIR